MKLYKYLNLSKSENIAYFYQMLFNCTMWCSNVDAFNDTQEFRFDFDYKESSVTKDLLIEVMKLHGKNPALTPEQKVEYVLSKNALEDYLKPIANEMIEKCRNGTGVSCFSMLHDDKNLWQRYGGEGNGVCIEFEVPDAHMGARYRVVDYVPKKIIHVDVFLEAGCGRNMSAMYQSLLVTKNDKEWQMEKEIRFIAQQPNINAPIVDGVIRKIIFGSCLKSGLREDIEKIMQTDSRTKNIAIISSGCN